MLRWDEESSILNGCDMYFCQCDCGDQKITRGFHLRGGRSISCGCFAREIASNKHKINLHGLTFGRWLVLNEVPNRKKRGCSVVV